MADADDRGVALVVRLGKRARASAITDRDGTTRIACLEGAWRRPFTVDENPAERTIDRWSRR